VLLRRFMSLVLIFRGMAYHSEKSAFKEKK